MHQLPYRHGTLAVTGRPAEKDSTLAALMCSSLEQGDSPPAFHPHVPKSLAERRFQVFQGIVDVRENALAIVKVHERLRDPRASQIALDDGGAEHARAGCQEGRDV